MSDIVDWPSRKYLTVPVMAQVLDRSPATIYSAAKEGLIKLYSFRGRTVAKTEDFQRFADAQLEDWTPSPKTKNATAARSGRANAAWEG
ncbi:helix-turn-helix domain-containing protein [Devosia marina]|uniref:Helix-turn-helix domain-containing protein n=1 Tax=Devosia marina TaxID=2683198 RepID=A0A7X3FNK3_9HYPH|nr:helix-turn-helix domain-containing protein [Devosia marina]MVS97899.1 hypothetical protein [Devosia marina]